MKVVEFEIPYNFHVGKFQSFLANFWKNLFEPGIGVLPSRPPRITHEVVSL
jgi:hypothetical protein